MTFSFFSEVILYYTRLLLFTLSSVYLCTSVTIYLVSVDCTRIESFHLTRIGCSPKMFVILIFAWWECVPWYTFCGLFLSSSTDFIWHEHKEQVLFFSFIEIQLLHITVYSITLFKMYKTQFNILIYCEMITTISWLIHLSPHIGVCVCVCVCVTFKIYSLSNI